MNIKMLGLALAVPLFAAACTMEDGKPDTNTTDTTVVITDAAQAADTCGAGNYQQFVGQKSPEISVPSTTPLRHYRSNDPVTMDFSAQRINFEYDNSGTLVKVSCG